MFRFLSDLINYPLRRAKLLLKRKLGWLGVPVILPYRGYGNHQQFYVKGRVIEDTGLSQPNVKDSIWHNILAMIKRYASSGIPQATVTLQMGEHQQQTTTDEDGYFSFSATPPSPQRWQEVDFFMDHLPKAVFANDCCERIQAAGEVVISSPNNAFGIITDIDDTLLISHSTNMRKKLKLMLFKNAVTRLPFPGAAAFYRALQQGKSGKSHHPIFYVSSSEWNLYDLLVDFCEHHQFPKGPFLLRDASIDLKKLWKAGSGDHNHKFDKICRIFDLHPQLSFVLVGDSGQRDAEIYQQIAIENPNRVEVIYIRDVRPSRHEAVQAIADTLAEQGIEMLLIKNTEEAAAHALKRDFITAESIQGIVTEKTLDQTVDDNLTQLLERVFSGES